MFFHNFKYTLKTLFRNKALIFWTFAFPIILGTFFNMAFSNITSSEKLNIIDIAIINNNNFNNNYIYRSAFSNLSNENSKERIFNTKYVSLEEAKELLETNKIVGYLNLVNDTPNLVLEKNGINQTIFKYVVEEINQTNNLINNLNNSEIDTKELYTKVLNLTNKNNINLKNISNNNIDYVMIEFYTLIAMTCLYGGILGMISINQNLANMSNKGKRIASSPTKKSTLILSSLLASYLVQIIGLFLLFIYTIFILNVDYGDKVFYIVLLSLIGSLTGLALGVAVGSLLKTNENTKTGILLGITMFGCFLSGMMGITMKYIIDKNIPIINKLNPASIITDGFYSLYYYDTLDRYYFNIISLLLITFVLIGLSFIGLRRQKYDSI